MNDSDYDNRLVYMLQQQEHMKQEIDSLQKSNGQFIGRIEYLEEKIRQMESYYEYETEYSDDAYNYLAIGNSLTLITSWGRGICSTRRDNDYFNLVCRALRGGRRQRCCSISI